MSKKELQDKLGLTSLGVLSVLAVGAMFFSNEAPTHIPQETHQEEVSQFQSENPHQNVEQHAGVSQLSDSDQKLVDLVNDCNEQLSNQEKVDSMIQVEVESGYYTPENPLVILDPYSQSPLTALICFVTDEPTRVDIHIEGEDEYTEVNHSFSELTTQHIIPVYGLYPDKLNPVTLSVYDEQGELLSVNISKIQTEPVSDHFQNLIILTETFQDGYCEGINYLYSQGKSAFDKNGEIRFFYTRTYYYDICEYNGHDNKFLLAYTFGYKFILFLEQDKLGKIYSIHFSSDGLHHDISPTSYNSLLITGFDPIGDTVEDYVYEIDLNTGEIINSLDFKYVLQRNRPAWATWETQGSNMQDWLHMNSVEYDESDGSIITSNNYQSAVVKTDWPSGEVRWILGNHDDWNPRMQQYLLTPIGEDFEWQYNQHAAEILPDYDNNPDTIDILLFDNGSTRFYQDAELQRQIRNNEIVEPELYSRMVHYRINEISMEVEQIWQYGKERGLELYSRIQSDADLLSNGNILGMFDHFINDETNHPILVEVTKESKLVWEAEIFKNTATGNKSEYRAERLPFYFDDDTEHDIYSTARNLIPDDIMQFVQNYNENPQIIPTEGENTDETT